MNIESRLNIINTVVSRGIDQARENAKHDGSWGDGGAGEIERKLRAFNDGVTFALTGVSELYGHILRKHDLEQDKEYQEYLRYKKKFKEV